MKIGLDCRAITKNKTGIGYYAYYLTKNLIEAYPEDSFVLFCEPKNLNSIDAVRRSLGEGGWRNVSVVVPKFSRYKKFLPFVYSHILFARAVKKEDLDVFHALSGTLPLTHRPARRLVRHSFSDGGSLGEGGGSAVVTVHDLAIYKHPEWFPAGQSFSTKVTVPKSLQKAAKIIAVSNATKKDLEEMEGQTSEQSHIGLLHNSDEASHIAVVPEGVDLEKFKPAENKQQTFKYVSEKFGVRLPYVLFLGTLEPRKNLVRLIQAWNHSREWFQGYQLVIAGGKGWNYQSIFDEIHRGQTSIVFTGYVSDADKVKLLQAAEVFAFPSLYEGFGLPVLEALACGTPVVCSNNSSLPEVGGEVPVYVEAESVEGIRQGLQKVLSDPQEQARQQKLARAQAEKFSWQNAAKETYKVYTEAVL